jgi:hypothetical protein
MTHGWRLSRHQTPAGSLISWAQLPIGNNERGAHDLLVGIMQVDSGLGGHDFPRSGT